MVQYYRYNSPFDLELGGQLASLTIAYNTYGTINADKSNVVWVCHALTANSDVADWWPHTVEKGCFLDPERWFVVCANIIGSHYGSTGPLSTNPLTDEPYYDSFPQITIRDMVSAHYLLAQHLGIDHIHTLIGSSVGGFQAIEMAIQRPHWYDKLVLIATDVKASPWTIAIDETQRMAIFADSTYGEKRADAGAAGMAAARAIGLLTYRGGEGYNRTQQDLPLSDPTIHRACSYMQYQGQKLCKRFNVYSYVTILNAFDTHDIGRNRGKIEDVLKSLTMNTLVIGLTTDIIFTPSTMINIANMIPNSIYKQIDSPFGHDGFLVEYEQLNRLLLNFM